MKLLMGALLCALAASSAMGEEMQLLRYQELIHRKPDHEATNVRVWKIRQDAMSRVHLVEMSGPLAMHKHPDASHSILVLEGSVRAQVGDKTMDLVVGDYLSIPANVPHRYWTLTPKAYVVSMDAPYYDPAKTITLEHNP